MRKITALAIDRAGIPDGLDYGRRRIVRVTRPGPLLDAAYALLENEFPPAELDPKGKYIDWLQKTETRNLEFPFLMYASVVEGSTEDYVAGVINGNLMPYGPTSFGPDNDRPVVLAIGYQVTSRVLREMGVRGIGRALWTEAMAGARSLAAETKLALRASIVESEPGAVAYWQHMGYEAPAGVRYLQPPLRFHPDGTPVFPPVPLLLMIRPETPSTVFRSADLREIITSVYRYWSLAYWRSRLDAKAYAKAEEYVLAGVLPQVLASVSEDERPLGAAS